MSSTTLILTKTTFTDGRAYKWTVSNPETEEVYADFYGADAFRNAIRFAPNARIKN